MKAHECYHCKQWIEEDEPHDCWTTTEAALTADLSEDLREAWERLRETVVEFGEQRIYASHRSIMFARKICYGFVRPKRSFLELWIFLRRPLRAPQVRKSMSSSPHKYAHMLHLRHRDEVEPPITDWLREAYEVVDLPRPKAPRSVSKRQSTRVRAAKRKSRKRPTKKTARR
jgi:hypothetical protein